MCRGRHLATVKSHTFSRRRCTTSASRDVMDIRRAVVALRWEDDDVPGAKTVEV